MNVSELIEKRYGIKTRTQANPLVVAVQTAITKILPNNPNRLGWMAINLSGENIFLAFDVGVTQIRGILLTPNGGSMSSLYEEDFEATCWNVYGVSTAGPSEIFVVEVLIDRSVEGGG